MLRLLMFFAAAAIAFVTCSTSDSNDYKPGNPDEIHLQAPTGSDESIDTKVFDVVNLDYPGLEAVKEYYQAGSYYQAASALLSYYRNRTEVFNPNVNLLNPTYTAAQKNMADQATKEGGYRFYIRNYQESTDDSGLAVYYSFAAKDGGIDWEYAPKGMADQEYFYQKHRLQWMEPQARVYKATGDEKYVTAWKEILGDWLKTCPCPEGSTDMMQWTGLQTSERTIAIINSFEYYKQSVNFTPDWLATLLITLDKSIENIRNNWYVTTSNIYLTQVQAELYAAVLMPELKRSQEWFDESKVALGSQLSEQFNADGVQNELDPSYHIGVLSDFLDIYDLIVANSRQAEIPSDYVRSLKNSARFVLDIMYPDCSLDNFNDTRSKTWTESVLRKNLRRYAGLFPEDQDFRYMYSERTQGNEPSSDMALYSTSGYYMMRNGWSPGSTMLVLKNNYNPDNKWHCQPDNGTIGIYSNGRHFLPDAGVYTYGGSADLNTARNVYRSTQIHNTLNKNGITIDSNHQKGRLVASGSGDGVEYIVTSNDSYTDLSHRRTVFFVDKTFFVIADEGYGSGSGFPVQICWNLCAGENDVSPDESYGDGGYGAHTVFPDNNNMVFKTFTETDDNKKVLNTTGYYSDAINERTQRRLYRVSINKQAGLAARFITVIYPFKSVSDFDSINILAAYTDNEDGTPSTFHEDGVKLRVTINDKTFNLSTASK